MCQAWFDFNDNPRRQVLSIFPGVCMRTLSYREVKHFPQSCVSNQDSFVTEFMCINTHLEVRVKCHKKNATNLLLNV